MNVLYSSIIFIGYFFSIFISSSYDNIGKDYMNWLIPIFIFYIFKKIIETCNIEKIDYHLPMKEESKPEYSAYNRSKTEKNFKSIYKQDLYLTIMIYLSFFIFTYSIILNFIQKDDVIISIIRDATIISMILSIVPTVIVYLFFIRPKVDHHKNEEEWWSSYENNEYKHYTKHIKSIFFDYQDLADSVINNKISYKSAKDIKDKRIEAKIKKEIYDEKLEKLKKTYDEKIAILLVNEKITENVANSLNHHKEKIADVEDLISKELNKDEIEDIFREHYTYEELSMSKKLGVPLELIQMYTYEKISIDQLKYVVKAANMSEDFKSNIYLLINEEIDFEDFKNICETNVFEGMSMKLISLMFGEADNEKITELKNSTKVIWTYYNQKNIIQHRFTFKNEILSDFEVNR